MADVIMAIDPGWTWRIVVACTLLMGAIIVMFLAIWYYRKRFLIDGRPPSSQTWTFHDIREMRDRGDLTEGEYQALRASMTAAFRRSDVPDASGGDRPASGPDPRPDFDLEKGPRA